MNNKLRNNKKVFLWVSYFREKKLEFSSILGRIRIRFSPIRILIHIKMMRIHNTALTSRTNKKQFLWFFIGLKLFLYLLLIIVNFVRVEINEDSVMIVDSGSSDDGGEVTYVCLSVCMSVCLSVKQRWFELRH